MPRACGTTAPQPPGPTRAQREKQFRTEMQQQQNTNKHVSRRKHARRRRGKHGGQGGGESRHCARVRETRQLRKVASQELLKRPTCAPRQAPHRARLKARSRRVSGPKQSPHTSCPRRDPAYRPSTPLRRPAAAASRRKLPGAAARHPTDHPEARFRTPAYLPDRPDRLAPCRGHAPDVTLRRP